VIKGIAYEWEVVNCCFKPELHRITLITWALVRGFGVLVLLCKMRIS
jgi:hypothetical protein